LLFQPCCGTHTLLFTRKLIDGTPPETGRYTNKKTLA